MHALILGSDKPGATDDLSRPLVGAPLLVRQLEWLQQAGITEVAINRVIGEALPGQLHAKPLSSTGVSVEWVPTAEALTPSELAQRAGFGDQIVVVLPHAVIGGWDLRDFVEALTDQDDSKQIAGDGACVWVGNPSRLHEPAQVIESPQWLRCLDNESASHELSEALLLRLLAGVEVRGTEIEPGIWRGRGAIVVEGARLEAPCLLGPRCFVADGTLIGPGAVLGEHAVVEAGAAVVHARVAPHVVVGQGVRVERACAFPGGLVRHAGREVPIDDDLLIAGQAKSSSPRLAAALALAAVAPAAVLLGGRTETVFRRLTRIVDATGAWVGPRKPEDEDGVMVDVLPVLVPPGAHGEECRAASALYTAKKRPALDAKLLLGRFLGSSFTPQEEGDG